jgi:uncharacterized membrane protein YedE/YeeE
MTAFTPWSGLAGGMLIGLAAVLLMAFGGRVAGVSGVIAAVLPPKPMQGVAWRVAFLAGLIVGPVLVYHSIAEFDLAYVVPPPVIVLAGMLVGAGTVLGSGCTSGHGICGVARASWRSIAATATFMAVAVLVVFLVRHG